jgi:hypothetical protein
MLLAENPPLDGRSHEILTLSRFHPRSSLDTPNSPLVCGKSWTKGDGDTVKKSNQSCEERNQETVWGCLRYRAERNLDGQ